MKPATISRTQKRRTTAEMTDDGVLAPQVYVMADEGTHGDVIRAVTQAVGENPNAVNAPAVTNRESDEYGELAFTYRPNELPVVGDGGVDGWLPPYRAEEKIRESLHDGLPDGWSFEMERQGRMVLFKEP